MVDILGNPGVKPSDFESGHAYVILNQEKHKTAVAVTAADRLMRAIPDPMPPLLSGDRSIEGVMFSEENEMLLIVSPLIYTPG
ncbi:MAG: hypothetical protein MK080_06285 [Opitutales bacterium]|nr:hypothetical protein [Opitutales bacterium]NRA27325.1 hypothetical protein [Opitutales bacterium]